MSVIIQLSLILIFWGLDVLLNFSLLFLAEYNLLCLSPGIIIHDSYFILGFLWETSAALETGNLHSTAVGADIRISVVTHKVWTFFQPPAFLSFLSSLAIDRTSCTQLFLILSALSNITINHYLHLHLSCSTQLSKFSLSTITCLAIIFIIPWQL